MGRHKLSYIECAYWSCPFQSVKFIVNKEAEKACFDKKKGLLNLKGHVGSNAPSWCQRRKKNGGKE